MARRAKMTVAERDKITSFLSRRLVDWRNNNISPVRDQGSSDSCVAHSVCTVLELSSYAKYKSIIDISRHDVWTGTSRRTARGKINPPTRSHVVRWMIQNGVISEQDSPWKLEFQEWKRLNGTKVLNFVRDESSLDAKSHLNVALALGDGPLVAGIRSGKKLKNYVGGPYRGDYFANASNHAVAVVALKLGACGDPYLVCQNSWGVYWGIGGFFDVPIIDAPCVFTQISKICLEDTIREEWHTEDKNDLEGASRQWIDVMKRNSNQAPHQRSSEMIAQQPSSDDEAQPICENEPKGASRQWIGVMKRNREVHEKIINQACDQRSSEMIAQQPSSDDEAQPISCENAPKDLKPEIISVIKRANKARLATVDFKLKERSFKDEEYFISPAPVNQHLEAGLSVRCGQDLGSNRLDSATMDLVADDNVGIQKQNSVYHWDKKSKNYVKLNNGEQVTASGKVKTEGVQRVKAQKTGIYKKWKASSHNKVSSTGTDNEGNVRETTTSQARLATVDFKLKERRFKDEEYFISPVPVNQHLEAGLSVRCGQDLGSNRLDSATMDLVADDNVGIQKQKSVYHWDKKSKNYVKLNNGEQVTASGKVKTEVGQRVKAQKTGIYKKWKASSHNKVSSTGTDNEGNVRETTTSQARLATVDFKLKERSFKDEEYFISPVPVNQHLEAGLSVRCGQDLGSNRNEMSEQVLENAFETHLP